MENLRLWFSLCQYLSGVVEIFNDAFKHGISVFYDNRCIESLAFNGCACGSDGKAFWAGIIFEPRQEQTIAVSLSPVAVITHIEQYIEMFCKKDIDDCQDGLFNHWVMSRTNLLHLLNDKLKSITSTYGCIFFKGNCIVNATFGFKNVPSLWRKHDVVKGMLINRVE